MTFLEAYATGDTVYRLAWPSGWFFLPGLAHPDGRLDLTLADILADDWRSVGEALE